MRFSFAAEYHTLNDIKEKHCYVAQDFNKEISGNSWLTLSDYLETNRNDCKYKLPDG